ncbi:unnamed protein product [Trichogramma brassicae]|uniref:DUF7041 domain-containing protein n=1 Tax=Trichogramma brassicae TaxID=86971 RepID=A0A6H5IHV0_9HYME|nr:unnamed protein product [Trichogramma brassicae]
MSTKLNQSMKYQKDLLLNASIMTDDDDDDGCDAKEIESRLLDRMTDYEDVVASLRDQLGTFADTMVKLQQHLTSHSVQQTQNPLASATASSCSVSTTNTASITRNSTVTTSSFSPGDTSMAPSNYPFKFQFNPGARPFSQTSFEAAHTSLTQTHSTDSPHSNVPISSVGFSQAPAAALNYSERFRYRPVEVSTFWNHDPASWFEQLDGEFLVLGMREDQVKYSSLLKCHRHGTCKAISAVIKSLPSTGKYDALKKHVISKYSLSA